MSVDVQWISGEATVQQAAQVMRDRSMGFLVVFDPKLNRLSGVVTDRDLALRVCAENKPSDKTSVADVATPEVLTCAAQDDLAVAEASMVAIKVARIVVLDGDGRPAGVISLTDILSRDSKGRAVDTARGVLSREAEGPHQPIDQIKLTPSTAKDEAAAMSHESVSRGSWTGSMKEFPG